jgi:hypothetical protein
MQAAQWLILDRDDATHLSYTPQERKNSMQSFIKN